MSFLGGINPTSLITQAALAIATGGTSALIQTALRQVMLSIGDQVLQQVGQQLGLPQSAVDLAQSAFHLQAGDAQGAGMNLQDAIGGLNDSVGGSPFDAGQLNNAANDTVQELVDSVLKRAREGSDEDGGNATQGAVGSKGRGESFLLALARVLGKVIDGKMDSLMKTAKNLDQAQSSGDKSHVSEMSAKIQALSQEISMLSNALNNSIKSLGEASTTLARKS